MCLYSQLAPVASTVSRPVLHRYSKLWKERAKLLKEDKRKQRTYGSCPEYPDNKCPAVVAFASTANAQLALYRSKKGVFARESVMHSAQMMPAYLWWDLNGGTVKELQTIARLVLAQPASASICERINSEFAFVKDRRRNGLKHDKANKLVSMFHNFRIFKNMTKSEYAESANPWTTDEDPMPSITKWGINHYQ